MSEEFKPTNRLRFIMRDFQTPRPYSVLQVWWYREIYPVGSTIPVSDGEWRDVPTEIETAVET